MASMAAGYLLGRSGRAKLALMVATYVASKKLQAKPLELLAGSPQLSQLTEQVRGELLSVGREALKAAADRRLGAFADSLAERTKSLSEAVDAVQEQEGEPDEEEREKEPAGEGEQARRPGRSRRETSERPTRKTAKKAPAKKAPPKKVAKKSAQKSARKTPAEQSRRRR